MRSRASSATAETTTPPKLWLGALQAAPLIAARRLRELLPGWSRPNVPVQAVYPASRYLTPKVRAFVDVAKESFERSLGRISL